MLEWVKQIADIEIDVRRFAAVAGVKWTNDKLLLVVDCHNRIFLKFKP